MGFAEKRGNYWRGRYKTAPGKHLTVVDDNGKAIRFATKGEAQRAASEAENKYRRGDWRDPALGQETFGEYANRWYEAQDLAASTMQNYKRHIEEHPTSRTRRSPASCARTSTCGRRRRRPSTRLPASRPGARRST